MGARLPMDQRSAFRYGATNLFLSMAWRTFLQNAYAERVIGSIRRACLDHVVVIRERSSPGDPVEVRRLLQWDPDPLIVGQGRTRATECAAAEPGQGGGGAPRGWAPPRIPPASGVSQWGE